MSSESDYYENDDLWQANHYLTDPQEKQRWDASLKIMPDVVNSLLDTGCGNGAFLHFLENERSVPMSGLERSKAAIKNKICTTEILNGDLQDMPFKDRSFDLVSNMEVLEHLPVNTYLKALSEITRIADRYILLTVPFNEARRSVECPSCQCTFNPFYHMRSFDMEKLSSLFDGFTLIDHELIFTKKTVFAIYLRRLKRAGKLPLAPKNAVCPQCGFSTRSTLSGSEEASPKKIKSFSEIVKTVWPKVNSPQWFLGLYERKK